MSGRDDPAAADTIVALATAAGAAGIGVIRVSGPRAGDIATTLLGRAPRPRRAELSTVRDAAGEPLDEALLLFFAGPHSFTGEDVLEVQGHGSPVLLQAIQRRLVELGARPARAGEFSERAFLNGKLDLAQAEAVADLIAAGSEAAARAALRSLQGAFSARVTTLLDALTRLRVHVEAAIDFTDEEIDFLADAAIATQLAAATEQVVALLEEGRRGARLRAGLHVAILGPPNAGKSSLLNALAGAERAIVTDRAGTTRDVLRETIDLGGIALTLADTAGLREHSGDVIELEGMRRARAESRQADLLLLVVSDGDRAAEAALREECPPDVPRLWVHNKIDLSGRPAQRTEVDGETHIALSVRRGDGVELLRAALCEHAAGGGEAVAFSARERHLDALLRCRQALTRAAGQLDAGHGELLAEELRLAQNALGEITGVFEADDLLGAIFSTFCIGK
jgi:tRNA modification GTPase